MSVVRQLVSIALAILVTVWILRSAPAPSMDAAPAEPVSAPRSAARLQPISEAAVAVESIQAPPVESEPVEEASPEPIAAAELGSREGDEASELRDLAPEPEEQPEESAGEASTAALDAPEPDAAQEIAAAEGPRRATAKELAEDDELNEAAQRELSGAQVALGFSTVLVSSPEDQLDIARAFGERVVLVPKAALGDGEAARSFELAFRTGGDARIVSAKGRPDLERSRQYRDLFAYDFQRLDPKLRELRRSVIRRDEVFLFAALIPASEWAIVIGRRREACEALEIDPDAVEQYVLRYVRDGAGFDLVVDELRLADGQRVRPPAPPRR